MTRSYCLHRRSIQHVLAEKQHFDKWACAEPWTCPFKRVYNLILTARYVRCSAYNACVIIAAAAVIVSPFPKLAIKQTAFVSLAFYTSQPERASTDPKGATAWDCNGLWITKLSAYHVTHVDIEAVITDRTPCSIVFDFYSPSISSGASF